MKILTVQLAANDFQSLIHEDQEGVFYAKTLKTSDMHYLNEHVVDGATVFDSDNIVVEVSPKGSVQLFDKDTDYAEEGVPVESPDRRALLEDAGFVFN